MPMSQLVVEVSKAELKPKQNFVTFEICCRTTTARRRGPLRPPVPQLLKGAGRAGRCLARRRGHAG